MTIVEISGFTKTYGTVMAVRDFSLAVEKGGIIALVGPDGAGKTTIFRGACGLITFDSGRISIAGLDVASEFDKIKSRLGYMPQNFSLYQDLSVEENLDFYAGLFGAGGDQLKRKKQVLYDFSGLGPFRRRRAGQLSGGMKQKLSLSCTLVHNPEVLILDEPTTGVDPVSRQQFWDILKDLRSQGSTLMVSTPYMDEVAMADRAVFVYGGKKLGEGTPRELAAQFRGRIYRLRAPLVAGQFDRLAALDGLGARRLGPSVYIYPRPDGRIEDFAAKMAALGVMPEMLEEVPPTLEDAFIQLMGK